MTNKNNMKKYIIALCLIIVSGCKPSDNDFNTKKVGLDDFSIVTKIQYLSDERFVKVVTFEYAYSTGRSGKIDIVTTKDFKLGDTLRLK